VRNAFFRGHGLGNDYLVVDPGELDFALVPAAVRRLCDRHRGVGADGLLALAASRRADFGLRIHNPDGSEAEKSGNGLRIFALWLRARGRTRRTRFRVETRGGVVAVRILDARPGWARVCVAMGRARFDPRSLPCALPGPELVDRELCVAGRRLRFTGVSLGNPHCVVFAPRGRAWSRDDLLRLGPRLERHPACPRRTNVQLASVTGRHTLRILVWERGAGETTASGTSACAAACAAVRRGAVVSPVRVRSPGGVLGVEVDADLAATLTGPAEELARGRLSPALVASLVGA
jgi:diaminopimelate epimerase